MLGMNDTHTLNKITKALQEHADKFGMDKTVNVLNSALQYNAHLADRTHMDSFGDPHISCKATGEFFEESHALSEAVRIISVEVQA